jgi:RNA polymerase sigma-70 factor (ECF subfamily)
VSRPELERSFAAAKAAWPELIVPFDEFIKASTLAGAVCAEDLYLVCSVRVGDARAIAYLRQRLRGVLVGTARRLGRSCDPAMLEDLEQDVLDRLLVRVGERPPAIERYAGLGSLEAWLRTVVARMMLHRHPSGGSRPVSAELLEQMEAPGDVELALIRRTSRGQLDAAFEAAVAQLTVRERTLLRFHLVAKESIDALGIRYGVHRSTAARWVIAARAKVLRATKEGLAERLQLRTSQVSSLVRALRSEMDVNVGVLLGSPAARVKR